MPETIYFTSSRGGVGPGTTYDILMGWGLAYAPGSEYIASNDNPNGYSVIVNEPVKGQDLSIPFDFKITLTIPGALDDLPNYYFVIGYFILPNSSSSEYWQSENPIFGSFIDEMGVLHSAVNEATGVRISRFPDGAASRELLALIADAKNASYKYERATNIHLLSYESRTTGEHVLTTSRNGGRNFA